MNQASSTTSKALCRQTQRLLERWPDLGREQREQLEAVLNDREHRANASSLCDCSVCRQQLAELRSLSERLGAARRAHRSIEYRGELPSTLRDAVASGSLSRPARSRWWWLAAPAATAVVMLFGLALYDRMPRPGPFEAAQVKVAVPTIEAEQEVGGHAVSPESTLAERSAVVETLVDRPSAPAMREGTDQGGSAAPDTTKSAVAKDAAAVAPSAMLAVIRRQANSQRPSSALARPTLRPSGLSLSPPPRPRLPTPRAQPNVDDVDPGMA